MTWDVSRRSTVMKGLGDSMREELGGCLDDSVRCIDLDGLVGDNVSPPPSSTDALAVDGDYAVFVEFKGGRLPPADGRDADVPRSVTVGLMRKAAETIQVFERKLAGSPEFSGCTRRRLIVVFRDDSMGIQNMMADMAGEGRFCLDFLRKYMARDSDGDTVFYDEVWCMSVSDFCRYANRHLVLGAGTG